MHCNTLCNLLKRRTTFQTPLICGCYREGKDTPKSSVFIPSLRLLWPGASIGGGGMTFAPPPRLCMSPSLKVWLGQLQLYWIHLQSSGYILKTAIRIAYFQKKKSWYDAHGYDLSKQEHSTEERLTILSSLAMYLQWDDAIVISDEFIGLHSVMTTIFFRENSSLLSKTV